MPAVCHSCELVELAAAGPSLPNTSTPVLWFKADAITGVAGGGAVTTWNDSSASGNNLSAVGTAPKYVAGSPGTLGGQPYVMFGSGGLTTAMQTASPLAISHDINATVFIVVETTAGSNGTFGWGNPLDPAGGATFGLVTNYMTTNNLSMEYGGSKPAEFGTTALYAEYLPDYGGREVCGPHQYHDHVERRRHPAADPTGQRRFDAGYYADPILPWPMVQLFAVSATWRYCRSHRLRFGAHPESVAGCRGVFGCQVFPCPVPEPASVVLMSVAAVFLVAGGRRRWKR